MDYTLTDPTKLTIGDNPVEVCNATTCWKAPIAVQKMPQVLNPDCGYVFNTNNTPYHSSCEAEFLNPDDYAVYMDGLPGDNNRSERFMELVTQKDQYSLADFKTLKWDNQYPKNSHFQNSIQPLYDLDPAKYPDLADFLAKLNQWDKVAHLESTGATIFYMALDYVFEVNDAMNAPFTVGVEADEALFVESARRGKAHLLEHFGTLDVPLKKLLVFVRQGEEHPILGFPDMLMANYGFPYEDGKFKLTYADTFIQFAVFGQDGLEQTETLLPFNTTIDLDKYQDQLPLYNQLKAKPMTLDKAVILDNAVATYSPAAFLGKNGEEVKLVKH